MKKSTSTNLTRRSFFKWLGFSGTAVFFSSTSASPLIAQIESDEHLRNTEKLQAYPHTIILDQRRHNTILRERAAQVFADRLDEDLFKALGKTGWPEQSEKV